MVQPKYIKFREEKSGVTEIEGICEDCMLLLEVCFCREALGHRLESGIFAETWRMELARQTSGKSIRQGRAGVREHVAVRGAYGGWREGGRHAPAEDAWL